MKIECYNIQRYHLQLPCIDYSIKYKIKNMINKMTKLCVSFVALTLMSNYVLSHEDYKYQNDENTNLKTLSRHKRQCK